MPMPCCPINSTSVPPYRRASGFPLLLTSLISVCASQPGPNDNRAGAKTWRMMGPRLVHLALPCLTPYGVPEQHLAHPDKPDSLHLEPLHPCACAWACAHRTPVQPRSIPCISHSATAPHLYATTVPTLSILNLVVFPSTVADHPFLGACWPRSTVPWAWLTRVLLLSHDSSPSPPPYTGPPSSALRGPSLCRR